MDEISIEEAAAETQKKDSDMTATTALDSAGKVPPTIRSRIAQFFCARYEFTKLTVLLTLGSVVLTGFLYFMMNVMGNVASRLSPDNKVVPILPDAGFNHIPSIKALYLTDVFDAITVAPAVIFILLHRTPMSCAVQALTVTSIGCLMRITTVAITSFPDPRLDCERIEGPAFSSVSLHRCGDAMFSGHTMLFVIGALIWTQFSPLTWLFRGITLLVWGAAIAGGIIIIANRAHYTVDVLVAFYVTVGAWHLVQWFWHKWIVLPNRWVALRYPHGNLYDSRGRKLVATQAALEPSVYADRSRPDTSELSLPMTMQDCRGPAAPTSAGPFSAPHTADTVRPQAV